ncbi:K02A2.6-like [Cordylochernes scorpioides]|uniref:K02A2.6-like n=1 Tax=Cordylochernes scorpioides TaxID=51811 RepID=A0ABY6KMA6_9ARAC|nr:K02A2.6-like [Cordylochernes scorpioides]
MKVKYASTLTDVTIMLQYPYEIDCKVESKGVRQNQHENLTKLKQTGWHLTRKQALLLKFSLLRELCCWIRQDLERFLGMITYLGRFIPNLSTLTVVLRNLLKKDVPWNWNASKDGLGAVLLQEYKPIAFASKAMNQTERNYAQIEKEALAMPLETIFKKPLYQTTARIQRFMLRLQKFDIEIKYKPGKEFVIADCLSSAFLQEEEGIDQELEAHICLVQETSSVSPKRLK